ncbi:HAD family hydrolase [Flavobacterium gilvum]|uniref:phosphoglycolate phosphatase n=1 Tax=Flavobacterium gilvum TaxID=1492737 RepID=A0AAC9N5X9_9FLAO|nr:HAD family hydrolase [Flavobacterium gilvum]AOW10451.1 HAD family hydrolase [Flavobacterium gilvum]KFC57737.1 HAD family hydrolase [Flavobacterium gilvum]
MKFKGVIFDLDGTLVNSLEDISDAMNIVLKNLDYPIHSYETYQYFIGSGLRNLVSKALPSTHNDDEHIDYCYQLMIEEYSGNCTRKTKAYNGIAELLEFLVSQNIKMSVFSNKSDALTKKIAADLFPGYFEPVVGLTTEALKKPNPSEAIEISKKLGLKTNEIIFVGDSGIDMQTATNAEMFAVGVTWGYRPEEELIVNGAKKTLNTPLDLIPLFQSDEVNVLI